MRRKEMGQLKVVVHAQGVRRFAARAPNRGRWSASAGVMMGGHNTSGQVGGS
jgi:hypothetical protein